MKNKPKHSRPAQSIASTIEIVEAAAEHLERRDGSTDPLVIALRARATRLRSTP